MTNMRRAARAHSNLFTAAILVMAVYLMWPIFTGVQSDPPQQTREETR